MTLQQLQEHKAGVVNQFNLFLAAPQPGGDILKHAGAIQFLATIQTFDMLIAKETGVDPTAQAQQSFFGPMGPT